MDALNCPSAGRWCRVCPPTKQTLKQNNFAAKMALSLSLMTQTKTHTNTSCCRTPGPLSFHATNVPVSTQESCLSLRCESHSDWMPTSRTPDVPTPSCTSLEANLRFPSLPAMVGDDPRDHDNKLLFGQGCHG